MAALRQPCAWSMRSALAHHTFMAHPALCSCPQSCYMQTCPHPTTLERYGPLREDLSEAELTALHHTTAALMVRHGLLADEVRDERSSREGYVNIKATVDGARLHSRGPSVGVGGASCGTKQRIDGVERAGSYICMELCLGDMRCQRHCPHPRPAP